MSGFVFNTAGEPEREKRSRRANGLEALGVCCLTFLILWPFCYACGVLGDSATIRQIAEWPLIAAICYALFVSPFWHGDTSDSLGLGNPRQLWRKLRASKPGRRFRICAAMAAVGGALIWLAFTHWPETVRLFRLPRAALHWEQTPDGYVKMALFVGVVATLIVTCAIRYDNFLSAFRTALKISAALFVYAGTAAVLDRGWSVFAAIEPRRYALDVLAYLFWGFFQQLFFTAYLGTRLRKAFGPSAHQSVAPENRWRVVLIGGAVAAAFLAPAVWFTIRGLYGAQAAPLSLLAWAVIFAFVPGAVWSWFYCRDRKRLLVATLTGSFFGLIHIDSYGLVLVTSGLGTILAWVFMEDRNRNLVALGFIHGFLGSTFGKLFKSTEAGPLRVDYRVGPWNVEDPTVWVLIVPIFCLAIYVGLTIWASRKIRASEERATPSPAHQDDAICASTEGNEGNKETVERPVPSQKSRPTS